MSKFVTVAAMGFLLSGTTAPAQDVFYWPAPSSVTTTGQGSRMYIPMGTPLLLRTRTEVNTKQSKPGDRLFLEVAESVSYREQIIVPVGSPAVAEVIRSERNGHFGKRGRIEIRVLHVQTPYGPVRLTGETADQGKGAGVWAIGGMALTGGLGFGLIHGTSGYIRHGTPVSAYLAEPLMFTSYPVQPAPNAAAAAQPDNARSLPTRFDPSVFSSAGPGFANR